MARTDDDVIKLVAWRRGHRVIRKLKKGKSVEGPLISPFNDTTEQLKKLFTRPKMWNVHFDREPQWKKHWLNEPKERVRELHASEAISITANMRDDFEPFFDFVGLSGLRWNVEARVLRWTEVFWQEGQIKIKGKGGTDIVVPITPAIRNIIWPLQGHHPEFVFTYVAQRTIDKVIKGRRHCLVKGKRYPLTKQGTKTAWRRLRKRAGIASGPDGFRFHDYRHNLATKLLRETGNLKLVNQALNHTKLETTMKYAHVLRDEVAAALVDVQAKISATAVGEVPDYVPDQIAQRVMKADRMRTTGNATSFLGDWGSRVQISALRPSLSHPCGGRTVAGRFGFPQALLRGRSRDRWRSLLPNFAAT